MERRAGVVLTTSGEIPYRRHGKRRRAPVRAFCGLSRVDLARFLRCFNGDFFVFMRLLWGGDRDFTPEKYFLYLFR